jgi:choline-sulfatase
MHYDYSRRYGFTDVGSNSNNNFKRGTDTRHDPTKLVTNRTSNWFDDFHPGDESSTILHDQKVTAGALEFFKNRTGKEKKPFFLLVGYLAPHFPIIAPESYWDNYKGKIGMPEIPAGFLDSLPVNYKCLRAGFQEENVAPDVVLRGRELYYALTEWVDNEIGKVLAAMRAHPAIAENTIIIYTADHGENMGEHGMWWKNCMYDQATKVPTIFNFPKRWKGGQRRELVTAHVDMVKTIVDLGGGKTPDDWNGDSMVPYLEDPRHTWKDFALSEYYAHNIASGYVMVRSGSWKYTYHTKISETLPDERQLYDLSTDPKEFNNLAAMPEHAARVKMMHAMMLRELGGVDPNLREQQCRREIAVGYNRTDKKPKGGNGGKEDA